MATATPLRKQQPAELYKLLRPEGGLIVFAAIDPESGAITVQTYHWPNDAKDIADFVEVWRNEGWNLHYCPNPPKRRISRKPRKSDMARGAFYWLDSDPPIRAGVSWEEARQELERDVLPRLKELDYVAIVDSGNGFQALLRAEPTENIAEYEAVNKAFGAAHGNVGTYNADRLLRLPGTWNYPNASKLGKGYPEEPSYARIVASNAEAVPLALEAMADQYPPEEIRDSTSVGDGAQPAELSPEQQEDVTARWESLLEEDKQVAGWWDGGEEGLNDTSCSARDFVIVRAARAGGFTFDEAWWLLTKRFEHGTVGRDGVTGATLRQMQRSWDRCGARSAREVFDEVVETRVPERWPAPKPIAPEAREPEPYPIDALPGVVRGAVEEVNHSIQAPVAMAAGEALAVISLVAQAHIDVERAPGLVGPVSLFFLGLYDSGERKSSAGGEFRKPIREWQEENEKKAKTARGFYKADLHRWELQKERAETALKKAIDNDDDAIEEATRRLGALEESMPMEPLVANYLLLDETFENLTWSLAYRWPSAGILTSEGGSFTDSRLMNKDNMVRSMSLLNSVWSGETYSVGRKTDKAFYTVDGARLTLSVQIQPETLGKFFDSSGTLARGIGFFARSLPCYPTSTIGTRLFREPDYMLGYKDEFESRIKNILDLDLPFNDENKLRPKKIPLSPRAMTVWREFHDHIETRLGSLGEYSDVKDIGAKIADVAARIAAALEFFLNPNVTVVSAHMMRCGIKIAKWHLHESQRFFNSLRQDADTKLLMQMDEVLRNRCAHTGKATVSYRDFVTYGPTALRGNSMELQRGQLLKQLVALDRIRLRRRGAKQLVIHVNPALIG